jgi:hypothetical protein
VKTFSKKQEKTPTPQVTTPNYYTTTPITTPNYYTSIIDTRHAEPPTLKKRK